jgi:hypothetical protein
MRVANLSASESSMHHGNCVSEEMQAYALIKSETYTIWEIKRSKILEREK